MQRQFGDILLGSIELFCLAAETGGFTSAALAAGVTPAAVSRTLRVVRTTNRSPSRFSSREIERLTAAGVTPAASAADVKPPVSAARQKSSMLPRRMSPNCRCMV